MFDKISWANDLFDNVATSFDAFNELIDVVVRNENFPKINREWKHDENIIALI